MEEESKNQNSALFKAIGLAAGLPWFEMIGELWKIGRKLMRGLSSEGIYEVLDYECRLELQDKTGEYATVQKQEKVRYLQDYITTYQDQAWGDGRDLLDYQLFTRDCMSMSISSGHNTYKLISLRESKNKGDIDEFNIEWKMRNGFLKPAGFWGTAINHRTKKVTVKVVFPKASRPPRSVSVFETNLQRTRVLGPEAHQQSTRWPSDHRVGEDQSPTLRRLHSQVGMVIRTNDRPAAPVILLLLGSSSTAHGCRSFRGMSRRPSKRSWQRSKRDTANLLRSARIVIPRDCNCQSPTFGPGHVSGYFLGPGFLSRAKYSLTARSLVSQSRPTFIPQISPCLTRSRR